MSKLLTQLSLNGNVIFMFTVRQRPVAREEGVALTLNVIAESTVASEIEHAWRMYESPLDDDPTFRQIIAELRDPIRQRDRKAITRGYPRNAFAEC